MFIFLIIVHVTVCIILIAVILLQAGKGGGLTQAFGGDSMQSVFGTQAPTLLKKATSVSAIVFLCTSLLIGMVTTRRGMSLFEKNKLSPIDGTNRTKTTKVTTSKVVKKSPKPVSTAAQPVTEGTAPVITTAATSKTVSAVKAAVQTVKKTALPAKKTATASNAGNNTQTSEKPVTQSGT